MTGGDGPKYKGHGLLQLTWEKNYEEFKKRLKIDCETNPELLASDIKNACNMAGSWWRNPLTGWGDINVKAEEDDLLMATLAINGGMNGLSHRYKYTQKALDSLGCKNCDKNKTKDIGNYSFDTSKIKDNSYCKKKGKTNEDRVNTIKTALNKAKNEYK